MALTFAKLVEQHYASLRRIAARAIRNRTHPERMSPTSLVAETVLRLMQQREKPKSEDHLRGLATVFMTRVLADASRTRMAQRRGGGKATRSMQDPTVEIDLSLLLAAWGTANQQVDLTGDGQVDGNDMAVLLAGWGTCAD